MNRQPSEIVLADQVETPETPTRRSFLQKAVAAGVITAGVAAARSAVAGPTNPNVLPNLYRGWNARQFKGIRIDEDVHVTYLLDALGGTEANGGMARNKPTFVDLRQPNLLAFAQVAKALENTGTGAYLGALSSISNRGLITAAGSIAQIEARHSGYLDVLFDLESTVNVYGEPQEFERPLTVQEVLDLAGGFIVSLNSDIPPTFSTNDADLGPENDLLILNFALALEYLEKEFYDINVPIFFP